MRPVDLTAPFERIAKPLLAPVRQTATVYLPSTDDAVKPAHRLDVQWSDLRRSLSGAARADLAALDELVTADRIGAEGVTAVAAEGAVHAAGPGLEDVDAPMASVAPVPALLPVLRWRQRQLPHLVVRADRVGADIDIRSSDQLVSRTVNGDEEHIHRSAPGGWSQRRFQQRAENTWEANARGVAEEVTARARETEARCVVVAGDDRAVGFLMAHLPTDAGSLVRRVPGARADWSAEAVAAEAARQVDTVAKQDLVLELERFGDALGGGSGVEGPTDVLTYLRRAQLERVLVVDDTADEVRERVWMGESAAHVHEERPDLGVPLWRAPLHDAVVRAAALTGARVVVIPAHGSHVPTRGLGGVLR